MHSYEGQQKYNHSYILSDACVRVTYVDKLSIATKPVPQNPARRRGTVTKSEKLN